MDSQRVGRARLIVDPSTLEPIVKPTPRVFRPEWWIRSLNCAAGIVLAAFGIPIASGFGAGMSPLLLISGIAVFILGTWVAARSVRLRIELDDEKLKVAGFLWSRTIPRGQIVGIDATDLEFPLVSWRTTSERLRLTPLTPVMLEPGPFVPKTLVERRRAFLRGVLAWSGADDWS